MRGLSVLLVLVGAAVSRGQVEECPQEQSIDWTIEKLLRHEDCNKFYKCTYGVPIEYVCYDGLYFNLETWQCDWPHLVDCEDRNDPALTTLAPTTTTTTTTTPAPTTTTTTTTTPAPTTTTTTTTTTTPAPTTTTTTTTTPAPTTTTTTTTEAPTTDCEVEVYPQPEPQPEPEEEKEIDFLLNGCPVDPHIHWLLPNAEDCTLFYYCVWGELVLRECSPGTHFNPTLQVCDWPRDAGCTVSVNKHADVRRNLLKKILS